jgi:hypothetical protein
VARARSIIAAELSTPVTRRAPNRSIMANDAKPVPQATSSTLS